MSHTAVVAIIFAVVIVSAIFAVVITVLRFLIRRLNNETLQQKAADERYRAAKKS